MIILFLTFDTEEEKEKFSEIYQDHAEFMMRVARRILQNSQDAEDVIQDAFLYVADHLEKINQFDRQKTRSYLAIITEHKAIDLLRSRHPEVSLDEQQLEHSLMADTKWEEGEDLAKALLELSPEYRKILLLHYHYGYSYREIAELLDQTTFAVTSKARRAKQLLAEILTRSE
ncbi:MAG: RNA polymerase sigma factor [Lachnospiraceae bacterium]|nr:RNA polymerase sigma factor [Lachnospiraceae bacterium]